VDGDGDGVVDGPTVLAHVDMAKRVRKYYKISPTSST
jgi:hypothetical protein